MSIKEEVEETRFLLDTNVLERTMRGLSFLGMAVRALTSPSKAAWMMALATRFTSASLRFLFTIAWYKTLALCKAAFILSLEILIPMMRPSLTLARTMNFLAVSLGFERAGAMLMDDDATEGRHMCFE
jgi:hypothetical protein